MKQRMRLFRITDEDLDSRKELRGLIERQLDDIVSTFYKNQTAIPEIANLIGDSGTLQRLISAQKRYILELFSKEIDLEYVENRLRIGLVHKRIGVDPKMYLSAITYLKGVLIRTIDVNFSDELYAKHLGNILLRLIDFDVSLVFDTYIKSMMTELEIERERSDKYVDDLETLVIERTRSLEKITRLDPLTNLLNKRSLDIKANKSFEIAKLKNEPISLIYIDINDFKSFNDSHGHEEGDAILVLVSDCIRSVSRNVDCCFRVGGDEFVVVMPGCTQESAKCNYIPRLEKEIAASREDVTLSIGIAQSGPEDYLPFKSTLHRADKDMYLQKRSKSTHSRDKIPRLVENKSVKNMDN
nr:GGDEF domain-containing protein [Vibrio penaeicida]